MVLLQVLCCLVPEESVQLKEWLAVDLSSTLDRERKKVQVVKRNLEAEEERLTSCLKIKKLKAIQWGLCWVVLLQVFVLCWAVPEESVHLPVKIASIVDQFFDIKSLFKMSEDGNGVEENVGAVLEDLIKAAEFLKIMQDCMESRTDHYNITKNFCKKEKFLRKKTKAWQRHT